MLLRLEKIEKINFKSISGMDMQELSGIAARMVDNFSRVLQANPLATAEVTKEKRTTQSAMEFVNRLKQLLDRKDSVHYNINDTTLRFFDIAPAYLALFYL
jgi:multiple inositol-polyphosphate phosphatase/2,3-bisphosphoglycerate 3-phosphatase